jgi:ABC-type dipeptide/oligopeptide/nickel transport system permease subunit
MLRTIIAKEIRANLLSFRFLVSFALLFVIVTVTSLVLTGDYLRRQDEHSQR